MILRDFCYLFLYGGKINASMGLKGFFIILQIFIELCEECDKCETNCVFYCRIDDDRICSYNNVCYTKKEKTIFSRTHISRLALINRNLFEEKLDLYAGYTIVLYFFKHQNVLLICGQRHNSFGIVLPKKHYNANRE